MPGVGDIVLFKVGPQQVEFINRARAKWVGTGKKPAGWVPGTMAHVGRAVELGQLLPLVVTDTTDGEVLNGQVLLPGNDSMWALEVRRGDGPAQWRPKP